MLGKVYEEKKIKVFCEFINIKYEFKRYEFVIKPMKITIANLAETYFSDKPAKIA